MLNYNAKDNKCTCGNETKNNLTCDPCLENSVPAYMVDENGKTMSVDELMANSVDVMTDC